MFDNDKSVCMIISDGVEPSNETASHIAICSPGKLHPATGFCIRRAERIMNIKSKHFD